MHDLLKNTTTDAAQCRYDFVVETQSCMISTKVEKHQVEKHHDKTWEMDPSLVSQGAPSFRGYMYCVEIPPPPGVS